MFFLILFAKEGNLKKRIIFICTQQYFLTSNQFMTTFSTNHSIIQKIESRLQKNQYLSNDCLPNFIDAQVFICLKASNHIPKRETYPNFYHWYILMRQFADRTLQHWLKAGHVHETDHAITELLGIFQGKQKQTDKKSQLTCHINHQSDVKSCQNPTIQTDERKEKCDKSMFQHIDQNEQIKFDLSKDKKDSTKVDSVTEYLMSIKVNCEIGKELEQIKKLFDVQNVKTKWVRFIKEKQAKENELFVWIEFETSKFVCEQLKNIILRYSNVQSIQCKKIKRTQSL